MKLSHLHLKDVYGNPKTLVCRLSEGSIRYSLFGGHSSSGTPFAISNLGISLPIDKVHEEETREEFSNRIKETINKSSYSVVNEVSTKITF
jgi:hypothetical protein|tara:strand:- start:7304 stop:7576 length:273 start_codon:yes stop_codon:yes gene_type:complete